ncbi:hypothetical protein F5Y14DRAFT_417329 [Nemania sp. NC0429]|nr:hypothetical protein F5Y14DRAFT_417329 [Nemania sp. NC0429]
MILQETQSMIGRGISNNFLEMISNIESEAFAGPVFLVFFFFLSFWQTLSPFRGKVLVCIRLSICLSQIVGILADSAIGL